jgi:hypothetical protein
MRANLEDEKALRILSECNYKIEDAILKYNQLKLSNDFSKQWTEEENEAFEEGYKEFGKDFRQIKENKVFLNRKKVFIFKEIFNFFKFKNNAIGELVNYYYLWKKTERHDLFINKFKIKKKNHLLHPTATDYMERFIIEREETLAEASTSIVSLLTPPAAVLHDSSNEINNKNIKSQNEIMEKNLAIE